MSWVAGVDGCKAGWVVTLLQSSGGAASFRVVPTFADVLALPEAPVVIAVDMPIGLLSIAVAGGRECDRHARALLGQPRGSSVFSAPVRPALAMKTYESACIANRQSTPAGIGISRQSFALFDKLNEVDAALSPALQERVFEVHPELCFYEMAGQRAAQHRKKGMAGRKERTRLLGAAGFQSVGPTARGVAADDVLDSMAACWTALRILNGTAVSTQSYPPVDSRGLRMEIWR